MKWAAIICAAGQGKRMGLGENKLFVDLAGKPLLIHTLEKWERVNEIEDVVIVVGKHEQERVRQLLHTYQIKGAWQIVVGGKERQDSVYQGLSALQEVRPDRVLIHDGARPFVTAHQIRTLMDQGVHHQAAILAIPVKDTIKIVSGTGLVRHTPDRSTLWAVQTPQMFDYTAILKAHEQAQQEGVQVTDDAALMEHMDVPVYIVEGSPHNIKLTTPEDIELAEFLLQRRRSDDVPNRTWL